MGTAVRLQRRLPEWDAFVDIGYNSIIGYCIDPEMSLLFGDRARDERREFSMQLRNRSHWPAQRGDITSVRLPSASTGMTALWTSVS
jgi:hypothetical protein